MKLLIHEMDELFNRGESFVLATVITRNGSAPRSAGAKMILRADGSTRGTVGGGILEAQVEQLGREILITHRSVVEHFAFSGNDAATMDAICGGKVDVLVEWMDAGDLLLAAVVKDLRTAVDARRKAWMVTSLPVGGKVSVHAVVRADQSVSGALPAGLDAETVVETRLMSILPVGGQQLVVEPLEIAGTVYIFGAGHVSRSLAEFTKAVGFWTVVLDDRPDYTTAERFPSADALVTLESFENILGMVEIDVDSFIVIVTRGHLHDRTVLGQALKTNAGYIGMIGRRRKCALIFEELRKSGFTDADIARVHAPIGLPIAAETPEEIGISITAEMVQLRAGMIKQE